MIPDDVRAILEEDADEDCTAPDVKRAIRAFLASTAVPEPECDCKVVWDNHDENCSWRRWAMGQSEPEGSRSSNPAPDGPCYSE
jgi:hypothetical protein